MEARGRAMPNASGSNAGSPCGHLPLMPLRARLHGVWMRCLKMLARANANVSANGIAAPFQGSVELSAGVSCLCCFPLRVVSA
jgi:hypothetical protein